MPLKVETEEITTWSLAAKNVAKIRDYGQHNMGNINFSGRQAGAIKNLHKAYIHYVYRKLEPELGLVSLLTSTLPPWACFQMAFCKCQQTSSETPWKGIYFLFHPGLWHQHLDLPQKDNFVGPMTSPGFRTWLKGIVKGLSIQWKGHVKWPVLDTSDQLHPLKVPAYYVLQTKLQLLSTTSFLQQFPGESNNMEAYQLTLSGTHGPGWRNSVVAWVNPSSNLPMTTTACWYSDVGSMPQALNAIITTVSTKNMNLSEGQKNLVCCWCSQLGYTSYKHIPSLMRSGTLAHSEGARHLHTVACKLT